LLHFNLTFSQCSTSIYLAFDGQTEFSRVFNFAILCYSRNSRKYDARKNTFYSNHMTTSSPQSDACFILANITDEWKN